MAKATMATRTAGKATGTVLLVQRICLSHKVQVGGVT